MANDDEKLRLAQVVGLAYNIKLQHANPPALASVERMSLPACFFPLNMSIDDESSM